MVTGKYSKKNKRQTANRKDIKSKAKCPSMYPYPYNNGKKCCQGEVNSPDSKICSTNNYINCDKPPCTQGEILNIKDNISGELSTIGEKVKKGLSDLENIF